MSKIAPILLAAVSAVAFIGCRTTDEDTVRGDSRGEGSAGGDELLVENVTQDKRGDAQSLDNLDPETLAIMRQQEALQPAVSLLYEAYLQSPESGFAGIVFEGAGVSLYWKGELTRGINSALNQARNGGASIQVKTADYSLAELRVGAEEIHTVVEASGGSDIQSIALKTDGSGLRVERMNASAVASLNAGRLAAGEKTVSSAIEILAQIKTGVAIEITTASETSSSTKLMSSRLDDSSPWNGGGRWESWRGLDHRGNCTTGFGVKNATRTFVLTAAHCGTPPDIAYQGKFGSDSFDKMGPVTAENWTYDIMLIDAPGYFKIFDGSPTTSNTKNVHGWGYHVKNEYLCQSGMTSGVVCGLKTGDSEDFKVSCESPDSDGDCGYTIKGTIKTVQVDGKTASRPGDSGGPVFSLMGDGVRAKGIVSAGGGTVMRFQDWADIKREYGAYPVTAP